MKTEQVVHEFAPVFDEYSEILVLGTMPSPKSREEGFYYGHPRNRFWKVMSEVCGEKLPETIEEKKDFALRNHIAVWDVLAGCEIKGAEDSSIRNPVPNDMGIVMNHADIKAVFSTGMKAASLYQKYCYPYTKMPIITLSSTSPANCRISYEELYKAYSKILKYLSKKTGRIGSF